MVYDWLAVLNYQRIPIELNLCVESRLTEVWIRQNWTVLLIFTVRTCLKLPLITEIPWTANLGPKVSKIKSWPVCLSECFSNPQTLLLTRHFWAATAANTGPNCLTLQPHRPPAYETAVDPWSNTIAMEIPSTYSPSLERFLNKEGLYVDGISIAIVLDHGSTA